MTGKNVILNKALGRKQWNS